MAPKRKRPKLYKYSKVGNWLQDFFRYLKEQKELKTVESFANLFGYNKRSSGYMLFSGEILVDLYNIDIYRDKLLLSENEMILLILMVHLAKTKTDFEEKIFKKLIKQNREVFENDYNKCISCN